MISLVSEDWRNSVVILRNIKSLFEGRKGAISSLGFMVESTGIDGFQCSKLNIKKNVPLGRAMKYWWKNACGSCSNNLDVVNFFPWERRMNWVTFKVSPSLFSEHLQWVMKLSILSSASKNLILMIFYPCSAKVPGLHVGHLFNTLQSKHNYILHLISRKYLQTYIFFLGPPGKRGKRGRRGETGKFLIS